MDRPTDPSDAAPGDDPDAPTALIAPDVPADATDAGRPVATLARVDVDPALIVDEQATAWCRHEVRRLVAWQLVGTSTLGLGVLVPLLWWRLGEPALAVVLAVIGAGALTAARFGLSLLVAPLGYRYVQRYTTSPPEFLLAHASATVEPVVTSVATVTTGTTVPSSTNGSVAGTAPVDLWDLDPDSPADDSIHGIHGTGGFDAHFAAAIGDPMAAHQHHPGPATTDPSGMVEAADVATEELSVTVAEAVVDVDGNPVPVRHAGTADVLRELGFSPVATVRVDGPNGRYTDLYQDHDRSVAAVDRTSGSTTVLTELVGFRVLVTSALLVPPTDELVVNVVEHGDTAGLVLSHQRLVHQAFRSRTRVSDPVGLFKLAQQRELEAYRELGPLWGAVLDLRCRPRGVRLLAAPSAGDVLLFTGNRLFRQTAREAAS